ncbi:MAG: DNA polymerase domain-containing protein [Thermoprotei archaeon]
MFRGWVLDILADDRGVKIVLSDGAHRQILRLKDVCFPLYFRAARYDLVTQLLEHDDVVREDVEKCFENWFEPPWYTTQGKIAHIEFTSYKSCRRVEKMLERSRAVQFYNRFPDPFTQVFWRLGYPSTAKLEVCDSVAKPLENSELIEYEQPAYSRAEIRFFDWYGETTLTATGSRPDRFDMLVEHAGERFSVRGEDVCRLSSYMKEIREIDVLMFPKPYAGLLYEAGLEPANSPVLLDRSRPGGPHVDDELVRLVEWSRVSWTPLRLLADASIGKPLTSNEAKIAYKRRWLVPDSPPRLEGYKTVVDLLNHDRGGMLLRPRADVFFNVAQLDFSSMYPSLIVRWNVSPETVNDPLAKSKRPVPGTLHEIEDSRKGVVPESLEWLISRRDQLKRLAQSSDNPVLELRQQAIKWLLVASFGYLGFRNAKFGKIEAYECVTALARYTVQKAIEALDAEGYRVVHVIVDSLFVQKHDCSPLSKEEVAHVLKIVSEVTELTLKEEAVYDWVVFSKNRGSVLASPQRYFGRKVNGELKVKGLDCIRTDTPEIVRKAQNEALRLLGKARSQQEFHKSLEAVRMLFERYKALVRSSRWRDGGVDNVGYDQSLFAFCIRSGRRVVEGGVGGHIWVVKGKQLYPAELGFSDIDSAYYLNLLERAFEQLCPPSVCG